MSEERFARLEAEVRGLRDQLEIRDILARYGHTADLGRATEYAELWTEDGVYDLDDGWTMEGREALKAMIRDPNGLHKRDIENRSMHVPTNVTVKVDGDMATASAYSMVIVKKPDGAYVVLTAGYNHYDFKRTSDGWKLKRRLRRAVGGEQWGGEIIAGGPAD